MPGPSYRHTSAVIILPMSRPLTMAVVIEELQGVLHNLRDLSERAGAPFDGTVITNLPFTYRDDPQVSYWDISITPVGEPINDTLDWPEEAKQ